MRLPRRLLHSGMVSRHCMLHQEREQEKISYDSRSANKRIFLRLLRALPKRRTYGRNAFLSRF